MSISFAYQIHTIRLMSDHLSFDISKQTFRMGSLVKKTIVVARRCNLYIIPHMWVLPHIYNANIFNWHKTNEDCIHQEGKQSNHYLVLIIKKIIDLGNHVQTSWTSNGIQRITFFRHEKNGVRGGTWTPNLFLRRETPYPLGHRDLHNLPLLFLLKCIVRMNGRNSVNKRWYKSGG